MSAKTEKEILEVKILVENDPKVMNFDKEKSTLTFDVTNGIPEEVKENTSLILKSSTPKQLEALVPFVQKIFDLERINDLKYDPNNPEESVKLYKATKKDLPKLKEVGEAFKPIIDEFDSRLKSIKDVRKYFDDHLRDKYALLDENFKEYVEEERLKAEEAKRKKEERDNAEREALIKAQNEANEKIKKQEIEKAVLVAESNINNILTNTTIQIPSLNMDGLEKYISSLNVLDFQSLIPQLDEDISIPEESLSRLKELFNTVMNSSMSVLNDKKNQLLEVEKRKEAEQQAEVLKAQSAQHFQQQQPQNIQPTPQQNPYGNVDPFGGGVPENNIPESKPYNQMSDYELLLKYEELSVEFADKVSALTEDLNILLGDVLEHIKEAPLKQHLEALPQKSLPKVDEWMLAIPKWIETAVNQYKQINNIK